MRTDSICSGPPASTHRSEEQSELCLKGDDTHRNVNGAEYFQGRIITWQKEDGWVSRKHLVVEVPLCYCKPRVKDDFNARANKAQLLSSCLAPLLSFKTLGIVKACWNFKASQGRSSVFFLWEMFSCSINSKLKENETQTKLKTEIWFCFSLISINLQMCCFF